MSEIGIGTIMVPDRTRHGYWIPIAMEDSVVDHQTIGTEAIIVGWMGTERVQLQHLQSGTMIIGCVDERFSNNNWEPPKVGHAQSDLVDIEKKESQKPFTTKKRCEDCNEDYPDDFKYCQTCGKELDVTHKEYNLDRDSNIIKSLRENIFSSKPKSEVPLYLYDQFGVKKSKNKSRD